MAAVLIAIVAVAAAGVWAVLWPSRQDEVADVGLDIDGEPLPEDGRPCTACGQQVPRNLPTQGGAR